jgi:hypothetical protein
MGGRGTNIFQLGCGQRVKVLGGIEGNADATGLGVYAKWALARYEAVLGGIQRKCLETLSKWLSPLVT